MREQAELTVRGRRAVLIDRPDFFSSDRCALDYDALRSNMSGHELFPPYGYDDWGWVAGDFLNNDVAHPYADMAHGAEWFGVDCRVDRLSIKVENNNNRAAKQGLVADLTVYQWKDVISWQERTCAYCEARGHLMDHFVPIFRGGGTTVTNVVLSCRSCNSAKRAKDPLVFLRSIRGGDAKLCLIRAMFNAMGEKYGKQPVAW